MPRRLPTELNARQILKCLEAQIGRDALTQKGALLQRKGKTSQSRPGVLQGTGEIHAICSTNNLTIACFRNWTCSPV